MATLGFTRPAVIKEAKRRLALSVAYTGIAVGICLGQAEMTPANPRIVQKLDRTENMGLVRAA